ncbi:MAG: hypothetical protein ACRYFZ_00940 [Janthinobacterium lividum]
MPKVNWGVVVSAVIAGVVVLLIQEFAFKRKLNSSTGEITSEVGI